MEHIMALGGVTAGFKAAVEEAEMPKLFQDSMETMIEIAEEACQIIVNQINEEIDARSKK